MQIATKTVTTRVHQATATADDLKGVAIAAVKRQLGLGDAAVLASSAELQADGSIVVEVVEAVADGTAPTPAEAPAAPVASAVAPAPAAPVVSGLVIPTA